MKYGSCNTVTGSFAGLDMTTTSLYYSFSVPDLSQIPIIVGMVHDLPYNAGQAFSWQILDYDAVTQTTTQLFIDNAGNNVIDYNAPGSLWGLGQQFGANGEVVNHTYYIRIFQNPAKVALPADNFFAFTINAGNSSTAGACSVLPIKFASINAQCLSNGSLQLQWQIGSPEQGTVYTIESSQDGKNFNTATSQIAEDGRNTNFSKNIFPKYYEQFFRVKARSINGTSVYSKIIISNCPLANENQIILAPNPVINEIVLNRLDLSQKHTISIFDSKGSLVQSVINPTSNIIHIAKLSPGLYSLKIDYDINLKFVKQ